MQTKFVIRTYKKAYLPSFLNTAFWDEDIAMLEGQAHDLGIMPFAREFKISRGTERKRNDCWIFPKFRLIVRVPTHVIAAVAIQDTEDGIELSACQLLNSWPQLQDLQLKLRQKNCTPLKINFPIENQEDLDCYEHGIWVPSTRIDLKSSTVYNIFMLEKSKGLRPKETSEKYRRNRGFHKRQFTCSIFFHQPINHQIPKIVCQSLWKAHVK